MLQAGRSNCADVGENSEQGENRVRLEPPRWAVTGMLVGKLGSSLSFDLHHRHISSTLYTRTKSKEGISMADLREDYMEARTVMHCRLRESSNESYKVSLAPSSDPSATKQSSRTAVIASSGRPNTL